jgi:hypothetical protein
MREFNVEPATGDADDLGRHHRPRLARPHQQAAPLVSPRGALFNPLESSTRPPVARASVLWLQPSRVRAPDLSENRTDFVRDRRGFEFAKALIPSTPDRSRLPGPIIAALCWAHARRQFFELADSRRRKGTAAISPLALEVVKRIDALFGIERGINGLAADERLRIRQQDSAPLVAALESGCARGDPACRARPPLLSQSTNAQALGRLCALPWRRTNLSDEQCRRTGPSRICTCSRWLDGIWGENEPTFDGLDQMQTVVAAAMDHYNAITAALDDGFKQIETKNTPTIARCSWPPTTSQIMTSCGPGFAASARLWRLHPNIEALLPKMNVCNHF